MENNKYNGKELDRMHGLDWYDYGARMYDPVIGRWTTVDPLAEKYYDVSPYVYCHNNPINRYDPNGMDDYFNQKGIYMYSHGDDPNMYVLQNGHFVSFQTLDLRHIDNRKIGANIIGHYASSIGVKYNNNGGKGFVGIAPLHDTDKYGDGVLAQTLGSSIYVKMVNGKLHHTLYNLFALKGTLRHENEHKKDNESKIRLDDIRHVEIILTEMENSDFRKTGEDYQQGQLGQLNDYLRKAAKDEKFNYDENYRQRYFRLSNRRNQIRDKLHF